jgi:hypothetical protein
VVGRRRQCFLVPMTSGPGLNARSIEPACQCMTKACGEQHRRRTRSSVALGPGARTGGSEHLAGRLGYSSAAHRNLSRGPMPPRLEATAGWWSVGELVLGANCLQARNDQAPPLCPSGAAAGQPSRDGAPTAGDWERGSAMVRTSFSGSGLNPTYRWGRVRRLNRRTVEALRGALGRSFTVR